MYVAIGQKHLTVAQLVKILSEACYMMSCSNGGKHMRAGGGKRSRATLKCCWKGKVLLLIHAKGSKRKGRLSIINLTTMIEIIKAQLLK